MSSSKYTMFKLKGISSVNSIGPLCKEENFRFTTVPWTALSDKFELYILAYYFENWLFTTVVLLQKRLAHFYCKKTYISNQNLTLSNPEKRQYCLLLIR